MKLTLIIHIDALRWDYVTEEFMPYLYRLHNRFLPQELHVPFGFDPDAAYLTGKKPDEYNGGAYYRYNPEATTFSYITKIAPFLDLLNIYTQYPIRKLLNKIVSGEAATERLKKSDFVSQIPFKLLRFFEPNDAYYPYEREFVENFPTVYDHLGAANMDYFYYGYPKYDCRINKIMENLDRNQLNNKKLLFFLIGDLDGVGHQFGPNSSEIKKTLRVVDDGIQQIVNICQKMYESVDVIAFGDHGMIEVKNGIDIEKRLQNIDLKLGKDYILFLDSTLVRFWNFSKHAEKKINMLMSQVEGIRLITQKERDKYSLNFRDNRFGDIIYWVDEGYMIFPNFWHRRKMKKGMHGYREEVKDNQSALVTNITDRSVTNSYLERPYLTMNDVFNITLASLGITQQGDV